MDGRRGLSVRMGLRMDASLVMGGSWRDWAEDWADGRERDNFFIFFLVDLAFAVSKGG